MGLDSDACEGFAHDFNIRAEDADMIVRLVCDVRWVETWDVGPLRPFVGYDESGTPYFK